MSVAAYMCPPPEWGRISPLAQPFAPPAPVVIIANPPSRAEFDYLCARVGALEAVLAKKPRRKRRSKP